MFFYHDMLVVDKGFRDSVGIMQVLGLNDTIPQCRCFIHQFSAKEANQSRCTAKRYFVVEASDRQLKKI